LILTKKTKKEQRKRMKRKITISIALVLSVVLVSLMISDRAATAAPIRTFVGDTGVITLGPNQMLRMTVANGLDTATVSFRGLEYTEGTCEGGVCKHMISSQTVSDPVMLAPGEAARLDIVGHETCSSCTAVRAVMTSNRKMTVNVLIINTTTGEVDAFFDTEMLQVM
jgi:predicted membrane protein